MGYTLYFEPSGETVEAPDVKTAAEEIQKRPYCGFWMERTEEHETKETAGA